MRRNATRTFLVMASLCATVGCASYRPTEPARAALPLPTEIQQYYSYPPNQTTAEVRETEQQPSYSVKEITLSVVGSSKPTEIVWYAPVTTEPRPLILISPIHGSDTFVVDGIARLFAVQGYHAAIVKRLRIRFHPEGPLTQVEDSLRTNVIRHRQALDWLLTQPNVDADRIGTFGISYGAIVNAVLAGIEPRAKVHVIDLAGGTLAEVMKTTAEPGIRRDWGRLRDGQNMTNREFYEALQKTLRTDPVKLAPYVERDDVLMLIAQFDHSVPAARQHELWRALGKPRADFVPLGHYTSILVLPAHRVNMMRFFEDHFAQPAPVPATTVSRRVRRDR